VLHGREPELARIAALVAGARAGTGGALVVLGDPGTGKSALVHQAAADADVRILRTQGVESEAPLAFAALHRLLQPMLPLAARLPAPQAHALRVAFGQETGSVDRFLVFLGALSLLAEEAAEHPVLAVVDDAHWLDDASSAALLFVARRLEVEPVALLFAARESDVRRFEPGDLPALRLGGLDLSAGSALVRERTGADVSAEVVAQLLAATGGNPLALAEVPQALSVEELGGRAPLPGRLPITATVERVFLDRARRLSPGAQTLLLVTAADDAAHVGTVASAAALLGVDAGALGELEGSGLLDVSAGELRLRHPLVRSAVYAAATDAERRAVHTALAAGLQGTDQSDRRAWHRAAAADGPDDAVVADLEAVATRAEARGGHEAAAAAWERAAELTADAGPRSRQLFAAARSAWLAGRGEQARRDAEAARAGADDPRLLASIERLRARLEWNIGSTRLAHRMLLEAARDIAPLDPDAARAMAMVAAALAAFHGDSGVGIEPAAFATLPPDVTELQRCYAELTLGLRAVEAGDWDAATTWIRRAIATARPLELDDQELLPNLALAALHIGDTGASEQFHQRQLTSARASGAVVVVLYALTRLTFSDIAHGRWADLASRQAEAVRLGAGTGQAALATMPRTSLLLLAAYRGDAAYDDLLAEVERGLQGETTGVLGPILRDLDRWARGVRAAPDWGTAFHHLAQVAHPLVQRSAGLDRVTTAVHAGQPEAAQLWIADLETFGTATGQSWPRALAAHGRALLASDEEAGDWYERSLEHHATSPRPFERARTQLAYGEHLRRRRRRVDARPHLREALATFEDLGAGPWATRAEQELRASGETARRRDANAAVELTPTERQVAQLVRGGLSNREVAAQLFVSPRTVDFHLRNVFAKTGIASRAGLAQVPLD
jgi:DNA-binding CsgD family transcriptional regulator